MPQSAVMRALHQLGNTFPVPVFAVFPREMVDAVITKLGHDADAIPAFRHRIDSSLRYLMNARHEVRKDGNRVNVK